MLNSEFKIRQYEIKQGSNNPNDSLPPRNAIHIHTRTLETWLVTQFSHRVPTVSVPLAVCNQRKTFIYKSRIRTGLQAVKP